MLDFYLRMRFLQIIYYNVNTSQDFSTADNSIINALNLLRNLKATDESVKSEISSKVTTLQQLQDLLPTIRQVSTLFTAIFYFSCFFLNIYNLHKIP